MKFNVLKRRSALSRVPRKPGAKIKLTDRIRGSFNLVRSRLIAWLSIALLVVLVVVPIILFVWLFFFTDIFNVQAITVIGAREDTMKAAHRIIDEQLDRGPLGKNIFFVQTDAIEEAIGSQLAQVRTVHVVRKLPATIKAIIQEKQPALLLLSNGKYYFVDEEGIAYEEARLDILPGIVLPTVKNNDKESRVILGVAAVQPELIKFLQQANEKLPEMVGAQLAEVHIPSLAAREVRVRLDNNWTILFDLTRSPEAQLKTLRQLLQETITPKEIEAMEYIDLRVTNRIYYKTRLGDSS